MKKRQNNLLAVALFLLLLFIGVASFTFHQCSWRIREGYLASEGSAAENFAVLTAANIRLTNAQVEKLKGYTYAQLMASDENRALADMMDSDSFANKVDYAYIMMHLQSADVKYTVTKENQERFDAPIGTKLDIMWLLDVNVSEGAAQLAMNHNVSELNRYSYYIEKDAQIFGGAPTYIYNDSEWGAHICGYAPIYTVEGQPIGVMGVELQTGDYDLYCGNAMRTLGVLVAVLLAALTGVFAFLYFKYRKMQFDRIYTDSLTRLSNRSYYNDRFIRHMNARASQGQFALMIADVDWFKKVNDTFGHAIGDEVLIELGAILLEVFGKEHVVRFGGEEFVVGLWVENPGYLREKINLLFKRVADHRFSRQELTISVSLGCCYCEKQELNGWLMSGMLRAADCKLYEAKENGRKQYRLERFDPNKVYTKSSGQKN